MKCFLGFNKLDLRINTPDDEWVFKEEPHSSRRQEILRKHPEIKRLMGYDPTIAYIVTAEVLVQVVMAWLLRDANWSTIFVLAYCFGGVLNHSLGSAIHEIGHNLAFGHSRPWANRLLSIWCNLPIVAPMAISYKKYHQDHHRYLGEENQDVDIPTRLESFLFRHPITKILWLMVHPIIHAIRPFYKSPKPLTGWELINTACQMTFNGLVLYFLGIKSLTYLLAGTLMALGFHPLAGHFISEHYLFHHGKQATTSYYGPLNLILFNVGYHIEHHDFPYIPYNRLPEVRKIAAEYYDHPYHTSWVRVLWDFVFDSDMGPHARGVGYRKDDMKDH